MRLQQRSRRGLSIRSKHTVNLSVSAFKHAPMTDDEWHAGHSQLLDLKPGPTTAVLMI
jgi:hypothetical protein